MLLINIHKFLMNVSMLKSFSPSLYVQDVLKLFNNVIGSGNILTRAITLAYWLLGKYSDNSRASYTSRNV